MTYSKHTWVNGSAPALEATNLNEIEQGIYDAHEMATGRAAAYVIAASDSAAHAKRQADYVCDGVADQVEIQAAIDEIDVYTSGTTPEMHGKSGADIILLPGRFSISGNIDIAKSITLRGSGFTATELTMADNSNCNMFTYLNYTGGSNQIYGCRMTDMLLRGNKANQTCMWYDHCGIKANLCDAIFDHLWIDDFGCGIYSSNSWSVQWNQISVEQCTEAIYFNASNYSEIRSIILEGFNTHNRTTLRADGTDSKIIAVRINNGYFGYSSPQEELIKIVGNVVDTSIRDSFFLYDRAAGKYDVLLEDHANGDPTNIDIKNNFFGSTAGAGDIYISPLSTKNIVAGNHFAHATPVNNAGSASIHHNVGYVTENSGTATLVNGTTSVAVPHGLSVTPAAGDIMAIPIESWGNMTQFYIDAYSSTLFTIVANVSAGKDLSFAWKAIVL